METREESRREKRKEGNLELELKHVLVGQLLLLRNFRASLLNRVLPHERLERLAEPHLVMLWLAVVVRLEMQAPKCSVRNCRRHLAQSCHKKPCSTGV